MAPTTLLRRGAGLAVGAALLATASPALAAPPATGLNITSVTSPVNRLTAAAVTVEGYGADRNAKVQVTVSDSTGQTVVLESTRVDRADGFFTVTLNTWTLADGQLLISAKQANKSDTETASKDTVAPAVPSVGLAPTPVNATNGPDLGVSGSSDEAGAYRAVVSDGVHEEVVEGSTDGAGAYSFVVDEGQFGEGTITATVVVTDAHGNASKQGSGSVLKDITAPSLSDLAVDPDPVGAATADAVEVSGTTNGEEGTSVLVALAGTVDGEPVVVEETVQAVDGAFSAVFDASQFADGVAALTASALPTDAAGNEGPLVDKTADKDTVAPAVSQVAGTYVGAGAGSTSVSGTTEPGASVALVLSVGEQAVEAGPVVAGQNGAFSAPVDVSSLPNGAVSIAAVASDAAGNTADSTGTFEKDSRARADRLAVDGVDRGLWVRGATGGFSALGGVLIDAPSIVSAGGRTFYLGLGTDRNLYVRTDVLGWQRFGPVGTSCSGPSAAAVGSTIAVACQGSDNRLYAAKATAPGQGLPSISGWTGLGGVLKHGVVVRAEGSGFRYTVVGGDDRVWSRTDSAGFSRVAGAPAAAGPIGVDSTGKAIVTTNAAGAVSLLRDGQVTQLGGAVVGRPAVTVDDDGAVRVYGLGADKRISRTSVSPLGHQTAWAVSGGAGNSGLAAVSATQ